MRLYIETSVLSFWFDPHERNREKRRSTRRLLLACREGLHQAFVSDVVVRELQLSREPFRSRDLRLVTRLGLSRVKYDGAAFGRVIEAYRQDALLSRLPEADLEHMATFSASDLEGMVTFNLRHLANQIMLDHVRKVNHAQGIDKDLKVAPSEAFLPPPAV